jgi:replicative DNA helicase
MVESAMNSGLARRATEKLRLPPHSLEAERSLLGGLMLDQRAWDMIADAVESADFYRADHRLIFEAVATLVEREQPPDAVTVAEALSRQGQLEAAGGLDYLAQLVGETPSAANIRAYARIVRERAMLRQLIQIGGDIAASAVDEEGRTVDELVDLAEQRVFEIAERGQRRGSGFVALKHILPKTIDRLDVLSHSEGDVTGVSTGFGDMDRLTAGLQRGDLVIIAGRPSMGKCIVSGSRILDPVTGRLETIDARVRERRGRLVSVDRCGRLRASAASAFIDDGIKPVYEVRTALGRRITVTASHPFLTLRGWQPLAALRVGTHVGVPRMLPFFGSKPLPEALVKLAARTIRAEPRAGIGVPAAIFELPREQAALFLHRSFAHGGRLEVRGSGEVSISYSTLNEAVARDLQHLLLRFGIAARLRQRPAQNDVRELVTYELEVLRGEDAGRFIREIGSFGTEQAAADRLYACLSPRERSPRIGVSALAAAVAKERLGTPDAERLGALDARRQHAAAGEADEIPADIWELIAAKKHTRDWRVILEAAGAAEGSGMSRRCLHRIGEVLDDDELRNLAESDIHWDRVEAIRFMGLKQVYDLTVPEHHNFVAEDVLVHNTTFAMNIAENAAIGGQVPVAIFSMEMSAEQLSFRMIGSIGRVNQSHLRTGRLSEEDWSRIDSAVSIMSNAPLYIDDSPGLTPTEVRARARRLKREHGLGLVVVDYLQLMQVAGNVENRTTEISEISRSLKALAKELDVPVIALSQLNRSVEQRADKKPVMSDLRESGAIEQDADLIVFIYREEVYEPDTPRKGIADIIIGKQRNGPIGEFHLTFLGEFTKFENLVAEAYGEGVF